LGRNDGRMRRMRCGLNCKGRGGEEEKEEYSICIMYNIRYNNISIIVYV